MSQREPGDCDGVAFNVAPEKRCQWATITGRHGVEPPPQAFADALTVSQIPCSASCSTLGICTSRATSRSPTAEAKALLENYRKIVDENYPDVRDMGGICAIKPDILGNNLQNSMEFANRFKTLKAEYEARVNCTNRIEQSLTQMTLPDISQAQSLLKSMIDTIEGDVRVVTEVQGKLSEFADKMDSSQKAMATLQKVHRAMCMTSK